MHNWWINRVRVMSIPLNEFIKDYQSLAATDMLWNESIISWSHLSRVLSIDRVIAEGF